MAANKKAVVMRIKKRAKAKPAAKKNTKGRKASPKKADAKPSKRSPRKAAAPQTDPQSGNSGERVKRKSRTDHLKPHQFKPGQSGNPKGRPKGKTTEEMFQEFLEGMVKDTSGRVLSRREAVVEIIFETGITKKRERIMVALLDRLWPKPIRIEGSVDHPLIVKDAVEPNLDHMSDEDLRELHRLNVLANSGGSDSGGG